MIIRYLVKYVCYAKFVLIVSILMLAIGEYKASEYANAFYIKDRQIKFGISVSRCVDIIFTDPEGLFYLYDGVEYCTEDNLQLNVKKLCGYGLERDSMFILVDIGQKDYVSMGFGCAKDVENKAPTLTYYRRSDVGWIILHQMPCCIYYWRLIAFVLTINLMLCIIIMCIRLVKKHE